MKMPQCWATARGNSSQCSNGARDSLIRPVTMCLNATRRSLSQCQNVARDRAQCCNTMNRIHSSWKYGIAILALSISLGHRKTLCLMVVALESAPPRGGRGSDVIKSVLWCSSKQKWHSLIEIPFPLCAGTQPDASCLNAKNIARNKAKCCHQTPHHNLCWRSTPISVPEINQDSLHVTTRYMGKR
jgi:hypothetical protein